MHHAFTTRPKNKKCDLTVFSEHGCHGDVVSVTEDVSIEPFSIFGDFDAD
jgi:hypothetical protein